MKTLNARNNVFLFHVKRLMNAKIYQSTLRLVNEKGEDAAIVYLQQFFSRPIDFKFFQEHI